MMPPSIWFLRAVRRDHQAGVGRAPDFLEPDLLVDLDLDHHGGERGDVLVAGEAEAAGAAFAKLALLEPAAHARRRLDHAARARGSDSSDRR